MSDPVSTSGNPGGNPDPDGPGISGPATSSGNPLPEDAGNPAPPDPQHPDGPGIS